MSRTGQKPDLASTAAAGASPADGGELEELSGVKCASDLGLARPRSAPPAAGAETSKVALADESERTQLIAALARLMNEPCVPEPTRVAGLTLIGWLARRRVEETPHALGIEEARKTACRTKATRNRAR